MFQIRSKWETDFADQYPFVKNREERMSLIENMMEHIKERNLLVGEALNKYKDLLVSVIVFFSYGSVFFCAVLVI